MEILSQKKESKFPPFGLLIGGPKVGKSTLCASIPNVLIADLEGKGYDHIGAEAIVKPETLDELRDILAYYFSEESKHTTLVIDHMRELTNFFASKIAKTNKVKTIDQISFGKGGSELRHDVYTLLKWIRSNTNDSKRVVLVAHSTDRKGEVRLDVDGKIDTLITSMVDYIGQIYRTGADTCVNFCASAGTESGCRNEYLSNYNGTADWAKLQEVASGT